MKVAIFSDLHVHAYRDFARVLGNGRNSRLQHTLNVLANIRDYCKAEDIEHVLFGGDLFHKKGVLSVSMYQAVYEELRQFKEAGLSLTLVVGNHDQATIDGKTHAIKTYEQVATVVDEPARVMLGKVSVWCVPYMDDPKEFRKALKAGAPADILLAHGALNGAASGPIEYRPPEEVEVADVPTDYGFRFFGHYHKRQKMGERCWYIGSPLQHSRGEAGETDKGFLVYDTDKRKFRNVPLGKPEFKAYTDKQAINADEVRGHFVDVEVDPDRRDLQDVLKEVSAMGAEAVNVIPVLKAKKTAQRLAVDPSMSPRMLVEKYVEEYAPDGLDDADTLAKALRYLEGM